MKTNFFDETPREAMRRELILEVRLALEGHTPTPEVSS
jgi:hypothetical protein